MNKMVLASSCVSYRAGQGVVRGETEALGCFLFLSITPPFFNSCTPTSRFYPKALAACLVSVVLVSKGKMSV